jgi:hypothetical protein
VGCHKIWLIYNFEPTPRGRNEDHKNKWILYHQTESDEDIGEDEESEKNHRFPPKELLF